MKDYYQILEVTTDCTSEQIRRNYRRLAMQYHPDRNPGNRLAEEKFKEIAEAYGVLTDPDKRRQYDASRQAGWNDSQSGDGFHYSQEDILRDLFRNAEFQQVLRSLFQEFQRSGLRADPQFISRSFFGGKGGLLLGGLFLFTSLGGGRLLGPVSGAVLRAAPVVLSVGGAIKKLLGGKAKAQPRKEPPPARNAMLDVIYHLPLTAAELRDGRTVTLQPDPQQPGSQLQVRIPPGSRAGQRLRLAGQGRREADHQGDLYLLLQEK